MDRHVAFLINDYDLSYQNNVQVKFNDNEFWTTVEILK